MASEAKYRAARALDQRQDFPMIEKTVAELSAALAAGETTSVALTQAYLDQIAAHNETLNAYIT
ncbi:MAG TPA: hypothetical protein DIT42_07185, partial [Gammaproteobacteria bacterium]|nr:hypothetical protein [Gammaproteobacteria bacterium]